MGLNWELHAESVFERTDSGRRALVYEDIAWSNEDLQVLALFTGETPLHVLRDLAGERAPVETAVPRLLNAGLLRERSLRHHGLTAGD